jgi:nucleotide-binding universal stress UspA family protein
MKVATATQVSFENIFLASDFTAASERALEYAKGLAKRYDSHLTVMHVSKPAERILIPEGGWVADSSENRGEEMQLKLLAEDLLCEGFDAESICAEGAVDSTVASIAESRHADLLVAGTHGRTGFDRLLYGSRAEGIARRATMPTLLVGPKVPALETPSWELKRVLCGVSIRPESAPVAAYAHRLASDNDAAFFLYYLDDVHAPARSDERHAVAHEIRRHMEVDGEEHNHDFAYLYHQPAAELVALAAKSKADLIVLSAGTHLLNLSRLHRDMVAYIATEAPCPVLVVPAS